MQTSAERSAERFGRTLADCCMLGWNDVFY